MDYSKLKDKALENLEDKWWPCVGLTLIHLFVSSSASYIPFGWLLVTGPLSVGLAIYYLNISRKSDASIEDLFKGFNNFGNTLLLGLLYFIFVFLWSLLLIIPGIIAAIGYSQAFYIMADDPKIKPMDALKESKEMMDGHKWEYFWLVVSFLGWAILCILSLGIGFLWLGPYMQMTFVQFYFELKGDEGLDLLEEFGASTSFE